MTSDIDLAPLPKGYRWKVQHKKMRIARGAEKMYVLCLQRKTKLLGWYTVSSRKMYHDVYHSASISSQMKHEELSIIRERELRKKVTGVHYVPEED